MSAKPIKTATIPASQREALGWVFRYGAWWPPLHKFRPYDLAKPPYTEGQLSAIESQEWRTALHDFFIEREMFLNPKMHKLAGFEGEPEHFKRIITAMFGGDFVPEKTRYHWNPMNEAMNEEAFKHRFLGFAGGGSSGKSTYGAIYVFMMYLLRPYEVKGLITSTTLADAQGRIWGEIEKFWNWSGAFFGSMDALPGKLVRSEGYIRGIDATGNPSRLTGLQLIPGGESQYKQTLTKIGFHAPFVILIADELPLLNMEFYTTVGSNLRTNKKYQMIGIGNPASYYDPFGVFTEPRDGWASISEDSEGWHTKDGYVLHIDMEKSPNVLAGRDVYPGILSYKTFRQYQEDLRNGAMSRANYARMVKGFYSATGDAESIYTEAEIITAQGDQSPTEKGWWVGPQVEGLSLDPAFTHDGDRAAATRFKTGKIYLAEQEMTVDAIEIMETRILGDTTQKNLDKSDLVAEEFVAWMKELGIEPRNTALDVTGGGKSFKSLLARIMGSRETLEVNFGGKYTAPPGQQKKERPYDDRVTEIWYLGKRLLKSCQLYGLKPAVIREMTARSYMTTSGSAVKVEGKKAMKKRTGKSPDLADSVFVGLELAIKRMRLSLDKDTAMNQKRPQSELSVLLEKMGMPSELFEPKSNGVRHHAQLTHEAAGWAS